MKMIPEARQFANSTEQRAAALPTTIGLILHYPVKQPSRPGRCDAQQFASWCDRYNSAAVRLPEASPFHPGDWDVCLSSDMRRAAHTTRHLWGEESGIVYSSALREVEIAPFCQTRLKLPHTLWSLIGRAAWYVSHPSQPETLRQTRARASSLVDSLRAFGEGQRVLIVSHGFFLLMLQRELRKRGYRSSGAWHRRRTIGEPLVWRLGAITVS
ncbi:histidine phosphatase family protein [Paenibacillus sp. PR3]|uniref:Histidine phosphatase family protein n=1 Tax=Paenibacillus terricola TaxID=2763503 RepID=A0ABR8N3N2_9BACL|nr:histidine phosphatase family protein [Paenibacillus terricola]MBD3922779.1 histidine phosphatase family protein [Paenibacillus terricola]